MALIHWIKIIGIGTVAASLALFSGMLSASAQSNMIPGGYTSRPLHTSHPTPPPGMAYPTGQTNVFTTPPNTTIITTPGTRVITTPGTAIRTPYGFTTIYGGSTATYSTPNGVIIVPNGTGITGGTIISPGVQSPQ